ncbi:hypothetical protein DL769_005296 [Monosporascus sp. CRB-8-3]|nr:hypothetical protein DL769_005296 [Monosporascus sp. CRB-8-3]
MLFFLKHLTTVLMLILMTQATPFTQADGTYTLQLESFTAVSTSSAVETASVMSQGVTATHVTTLSLAATTVQHVVRSAASSAGSTAFTPTTQQDATETHVVKCGSDEDAYTLLTTISGTNGQLLLRAPKKSRPKTTKGSESEEDEERECQAPSETSQTSEGPSSRTITFIAVGCVLGTAMLGSAILIFIIHSRRRRSTTQVNTEHNESASEQNGRAH